MDQRLNQFGDLAANLHNLIDKFGPRDFAHDENRRLALDFQQIPVGDDTGDVIVCIPDAKMFDISLHHSHQGLKHQSIRRNGA